MKRFNGYLFKETDAPELDGNELQVLIQAAEKDWTEVEPAIFGTLLERALNPKERAKLGAHSQNEFAASIADCANSMIAGCIVRLDATKRIAAGQNGTMDNGQRDVGTAECRCAGSESKLG